MTEFLDSVIIYPVNSPIKPIIRKKLIKFTIR